VSDSLFDLPSDDAWTDSSASGSAPLAVRMRPAALEEVVGQAHLLGPGSPLRRLVEGTGAASVIL
jgi:putative ATPase